MKHLFIRADSTGNIGTGHIMRCLALAQGWQDEGGKVTFISHCESVALRQRIVEEGFDFASITNPHPDPSDLCETLSLVFAGMNLRYGTDSPAGAWLVLDGYHFSCDYQRSIRDAGIHLLVIDDMNHLPSYHADILLNQNFHAQELSYKHDKDTTLLLGCKYTLLRREFLKYNGLERDIPERSTNILVTFGGADPNNLALKTIQAVNLIRNPKIEMKVVVGPANQRLREIRDEVVISAHTCHILSNVYTMPELMEWADMAVSAGGSTSWELAFMGVPNIVIPLAENQKRAMRSLEEIGAVHNLGLWDEINGERLVFEMEQLLGSANKREFMSKLGQSLVDGGGTVRVVDVIRGLYE